MFIMLSKIKSHLKDADKYFEHQKFALKVSWKCLCSSFTALIHSICPAFFEYTTSSKIKEMQFGANLRNEKRKHNIKIRMNIRLPHLTLCTLFWSETL